MVFILMKGINASIMLNFQFVVILMEWQKLRNTSMNLIYLMTMLILLIVNLAAVRFSYSSFTFSPGISIDVLSLSYEQYIFISLIASGCELYL